MIETLIDVLELLDRLAEKKYRPTRIWNLYRVLKGDKGTRKDGDPKKNLRTKDMTKESR